MGKGHGRELNRFLYYAFGGGLGHVVRLTALARRLARRGGDHVIACNTPFRDSVKQLIQTEVLAESSLRCEYVPANLNADQSGQAMRAIHSAFAPDILVVDTFPRGLGGELVDLLETEKHALRVLISRSLPRQYVESYRLGRFVGNHFDLVISPGESFGVGPQDIPDANRGRPRFVETGPFLIRDCDELPNRESAARILSVDGRSPVVLIVASGNEVECREMAELYFAMRKQLEKPRGQIRLGWPFPDSRLLDEVRPSNGGRFDGGILRHWPMIECLPAVNLVVGSAGYNLYWETDSLKIASLLQPRIRMYDAQARRANVSSPVEWSDVMRRMAEIEIAAGVAKYDNGTGDAADVINSLLPSSVEDG